MSGELVDELKTLLTGLDSDQQHKLVKLLTKSGHPLSDLTESVVPFVHSWLRADLDGDFSVFEDANSMTSPPVTKDFTDAFEVKLPTPAAELDVNLGDVITKRRSRHHAEADQISLDELSTFLHWTYGIKNYIPAYNHKDFPVRMTPSAGGLQPVDVYMVVNSVEGVEQGVYYYQPEKHVLQRRDHGNARWRLSRACIYADWIGYSPIVFALSVSMPRVHWKYGDRGYRFVHVDAGVLAQSMYLTGTALNWNVCAVAAFYDEFIAQLIGVDGCEEFPTLLFGAAHPPIASVLSEYRDE